MKPFFIGRLPTVFNFDLTSFQEVITAINIAARRY